MKTTKQQIIWKDLRKLNHLQIGFNLVSPYPFLILSLWFAHMSHFLFAIPCTFLFFTAGFRQAHDGFHNTLGIGKKSTELLLFLLSAVMLTSTHAIKQTHLQHHRTPLAKHDIEASFAHLAWYQAIFGGFKHWYDVQKAGYLLARSKNNKTLITVVLDYGLISIFLITALIYIPQAFFYHTLVMVLGNAMVGFIAGWCVHHDCDEEIIARTERNPLVNLLTFNLLYHMEHHLYPSVPTNNLPKLAMRLDRVCNKYANKPVVPKLKLAQKLKPNPIKKTMVEHLRR
ncbi:fatty acid desaturase [Psychrobacter sp. HD31]|uniref:fatty acid desaturase family protein n=1 Tax=Psychrobacter sp. HD31 TaxID=3112003 RepID=UPI003DA365FA